MTEDPWAPDPLADDGTRLERVLVAHQGRFLTYLERRLENRPDAEELLQAAYTRALEKGLPDDGTEGVIAWFFTLLRNAVVDRARRVDAAERAMGRLARELEDADTSELKVAVCGCMHDLLPGMKPGYADVIRAVDLQERSLAEVAESSGITVNNATVRLHRARQALKKQLLRVCGACAAHGCLDCGCRTAGRSQGPSTG
jgi:RNA polymerase sigma-70 factor (ECF subfamily)